MRSSELVAPYEVQGDREKKDEQELPMESHSGQGGKEPKWGKKPEWHLQNFAFGLSIRNILLQFLWRILQIIYVNS